MRRNQFSGFISGVLVIMAVTWILASSAAAASEFKILHVFNWASTPQGNLVIDAAGNVYGVAAQGASTACSIPGGPPFGGIGCGVVFKLTPNPNGTWTETTIHTFAGGSEGGLPKAGLTLDAAGNLYGTTAYYGNGGGVLFELMPNTDGTWTYKVLSDIHYDSFSTLIFDAAGNLFATSGGTDGYGDAFELMPNGDGTWTEKELYSFVYFSSTGYIPRAGLILDAAGNAYGTAWVISTGCYCGLVFKLTPSSSGPWTESILHTFTNGPDGGNPLAGLIWDAAGNLYGTGSTGGAYGNGVVFKLTPNSDGTWTESTLHSFKGADGASPQAGLMFDAAGNLYGTTAGGGYSGYGVVFKLAPNSDGTWTESILHSFLGYGQAPLGGVTMDKAGNLYGTASAGSGNNGIVFEITP